MKNLIVSFVAVLGLMCHSGLAQSNKTIQQKSNTEEPRTEYKKSEDVNKTEISPRELPEEARREIVDNYHNAEVIRAYRITYPGADQSGYLVEVKKGPKEWDIEFDSEGNVMNKINPIH